VCAWAPCLQDVAAWEAHPEWRAKMVDDGGHAVEQSGWLCPTSEEAVQYETAIAQEIVRNYPKLSAIFTDFIRLDSDLSCACDRCLKRVSDKHGAPVTALDLKAEHDQPGRLWRQWTNLRARAICDVVDALRDGIEEARPDFWFGACVLPFSAADYSFNTQSGQDYYEMARVGLDELVIMGYWDDWEKSPAWLAAGLDSAHELVKGECELSCLLDGDMAVRRTWLTLDAIRGAPVDRLRYFKYHEWRARRRAPIRHAQPRHDQPAGGAVRRGSGQGDIRHMRAHRRAAAERGEGSCAARA
jgi:hypothetical protein